MGTCTRLEDALLCRPCNSHVPIHLCRTSLHMSMLYGLETMQELQSWSWDYHARCLLKNHPSGCPVITFSYAACQRDERQIPCTVACKSTSLLPKTAGSASCMYEAGHVSQAEADSGSQRESNNDWPLKRKARVPPWPAQLPARPTKPAARQKA